MFAALTPVRACSFFSCASHVHFLVGLSMHGSNAHVQYVNSQSMSDAALLLQISHEERFWCPRKNVIATLFGLELSNTKSESHCVFTLVMRLNHVIRSVTSWHFVNFSNASTCFKMYFSFFFPIPTQEIIQTKSLHRSSVQCSVSCSKVCQSL